MNLTNKVFYSLVVLALIFITFSLVSADTGDNYVMMGNGYNQQMNGSNDYWNKEGQGYGMMGARGMGMMDTSSMMNMMMGYGNKMMDGYGVNNYDYSLQAVGMTEEEVKQLATRLVKTQFGLEFQIADIFIYSNSPYYISVIKRNSGEGAFELLFDPYSKVIYPEYGPNMMWNTEYGMSHMMGWGSPATENMLERQKTLDMAKENARINGFDVEQEGHLFPGYYTFHTEENNKTAGMLSVNAYTGQVWYHSWHGKLEKVIKLKNLQE